MRRKKLEFAKAKILATISFAFIAWQGLEAQCDKSFVRSSMTKEQIYERYAGAVLRIQNEESKGTGYLIDSDKGYVLTAAHVVDPALKNPALPISATTRDLPGVELFLEVVMEDRKHDLVLLRSKDPSGLRSLKALDVSLQFPKEGRPLYAMGYPTYPTQKSDPEKGLVVLEKESAELVDSANGLLIVKQSNFPGESGSPLIDETGLVIATCRERIGGSDLGSDTAEYVPMSRALDLIKKIPPSPRIMSLDKRIQSNSISKDELVIHLLPLDGRCSNVELLTWSFVAAGLPSQTYAKARALFTCPIFQSLTERSLVVAAMSIAHLLGSADAGRALLLSGKRAVEMEEPESAREMLAASVISLRAAINEWGSANPEGLSQALCRSGILNRTTALNDGGDGASLGGAQWLTIDVEPAEWGNSLPSLKRSLCLNVQSDSYLAGLFQDHALAALYMSRVTDNPDREFWVREAVTSGSFAISAQGSGQQQSVAYTVFGDALFALKQHLPAAAAYATAYRQGFRQEWVEINWAHAVRAARKDGKSLPKDLTIGNSPTLSVEGMVKALALGADPLALRYRMPS